MHQYQRCRGNGRPILTLVTTMLRPVAKRANQTVETFVGSSQIGLAMARWEWAVGP